MSIKDGKVSLYFAAHKNRLIVGGLMLMQFVLTLVLSVSLAAQIIWPEQTKAAAGTPMQLSYEGRLTDSSGNALGGTGTTYCYRFSIYDSASAGNKLWPGGSPSQTLATTTDGVFSAIIGQADTLSSSVFDFSTTSTSYLQVEVNTVTSTCGGTWEALTPRQPILSSAYALQANNVYGAYLKTDTINGRVQVGTGAGAATPVYLGLDVKNTADAVGQSCSTNGLMWYNSAVSLGLICEGGVMQNLGVTGTTSIAALQANGGTPISIGTVYLSNSNGVSFGANGSTITASVNGGGATLNDFEWPPAGQASNPVAMSNATLALVPFDLQQNLTATRAAILASVSIGTSTSGTTTGTWSMSVGIYSKNGSTLSLASSGSSAFTINNTSNASTSVYNGLRRFNIPININATPGNWWYAVWIKSSGNGNSLSLIYASQVTQQFSGNFGSSTNASQHFRPGLGIYSASVTTAMPATVAFSNIQGAGAAGTIREPWILFSNDEF